MTPFERALADVENSIRAGWHEKHKLWYPHQSLEGGNDTIAYGHKLTNQELYSDWVYAGLTEEQALLLLRLDIAKAEKSLTLRIEDFKELPEKYRKVLVSIQFNTGNVTEGTWPKLLNAMRVGDDARVREEMVTTYRSPDGKRHRLTARANAIAEALGI